MRASTVLHLPQAAVTLARVELGLRRSTLPDLCERLGVPLVQVDRPVLLADRPEDVLPPWTGPRRAAVEVVLHRWPFGNTCLRRSLALGHLIKRLHPELRVGMRMDGGQLKAHAWLDVEGRSLDLEAGSFVGLGQDRLTP